MKLGFFHDHIFVNKEDVRYTSGTLDKDLWKRYLLPGVTEVVICCRERNYIEGERLGAISTRSNVTFTPSPNLSNLKSLTFNYSHNTVEEVVKELDFIVARLPSEIGLAAIKYANRYKKKVICEVVGCPYDALKGYGTLKASIYAPIIKNRMKKGVEKCDGALYVTKEALQKRYPNRCSENASNVVISHVRDDCLKDRIQAFNANNSITIGLIGALDNDIKGIDVAIKALSGVDNIKFRVLGKGDPTRFKELAKSYHVDVSFDGFMSDKDKLFSWLDNIDIYIQPSFQEGLPRATIEAMSRGCIIASSDAGGLGELTLSEFIHNSGDYRKLNKDILRIIKSSQLDKEMYIKHSLNEASNYLSDKLKDRRTKFYTSIFKK